MSEDCRKKRNYRPHPKNPQLDLWRERLALFRVRKKKLIDLVLAALGPEQAAVWFKTVHPDLGYAPRTRLKPYGIKKMLEFARKQFKR